MTGKGVTIQIGYYPGSGGQVKKDDKGYYYDSGNKVNTPEKGGKIGKINKGKRRVVVPVINVPVVKQVSAYTHGTDSGTYYRHYIPGSGSVSGFKNGGKWQRGLPSLKSVSGSVIRVYCDNSDQKPIAIAQQATTTYWFRRNTSDENAWTAVATAPNQASSALSTPSVDLDLSKMDGKYNFGGTEIKMAVLLSHIGDGYYRYLYSLRGAPFKATEIKHGQGTTLSGIDTSTNPLLSVSAYYLGDSPNLDKLLLELRSQGGKNYNYFYRDKKDAPTWSPYLGSGGKTGKQLVGSSLKTELDKLKKTQFPDPPPDILQQILDFLNSTSGKITEGVTGGLTTAGTLGYGGYKLFISLATRL
ncbi:hypothetical protein BEWA_041910 [Theileria equi strain WA]|uniref:Uncharacterized protein n=1 Tax=Theileria equi strain WA TaxID=1537102 RepID=L1LG69_THEEQ|nr:hypothetical protein BEWA_041910 [Theileria equi strain WA]EKX74153.1 hypothetical protein BEWA_041910 [Theileria equi strain WA]|eukprot:XP_004833605.1 hypothetical protein BEWA_041910 [Theileria equi strain WA]